MIISYKEISGSFVVYFCDVRTENLKVMQRYYVIQGANSIIKTKTTKRDGRSLLTHKEANFVGG
jgi:hypothetical protein